MSGAIFGRFGRAPTTLIILRRWLIGYILSTFEEYSIHRNYIGLIRIKSTSEGRGLPDSPVGDLAETLTLPHKQNSLDVPRKQPRNDLKSLRERDEQVRMPDKSPNLYLGEVCNIIVSAANESGC